MCGRFTLYAGVPELVQRFSLKELLAGYQASYNIAPTQSILAVTAVGQERCASLLRWGLIPPWQKEPQKGAPLINARIETVAEKPSFRNLVNSKRCLIVANGFYEWLTENSKKHPVYITADQGRPFAFAGLWNDGSIPSCTIITQEAIPLLKPVHDRMPVILTPETENLWLSPRPFSEVRELLPDQREHHLAYYRVSTMVNSPKHNTPDCIVNVGDPLRLPLE